MRPELPPTLSDLLVVEDDAAILDYHCHASQILLWPSVRSVFFRMAMSDFLYATPLNGSVNAEAPLRRAVMTLSGSILRNLWMRSRRRARADVCLMSSGVGNQSVDGHAMNRLTDHFALVDPSGTITIEEHFQWRWSPARAQRPVIFHAPLQVANSLGARLRVRRVHLRQARELIALVSERSQRFLNWRPGRQREEDLVKMLARKAAGMSMQLNRYETLLKRIRPKVLLTLAGCYGTSAVLIAAARRIGIVTAEYQHGVIAPGHDGYNFAQTLRDSAAFKSTLPEYFLSYGTWWSGQINAPVRMIAVGNPNRDFRFDRTSRLETRKDTILILSDGSEFEIYLDLAMAIEPEARRRGLQIVIRPHPIERSQIAAKRGHQIGGVSIDHNEDLYASLRRAHIVISELSTALFEAAGIADKLFLWDTPKARFTFPTSPFNHFKDASGLARLLEDDRNGRLTRPEIDALWAPGWRDNYSRFLEQCGVSRNFGGRRV